MASVVSHAKSLKCVEKILNVSPLGLGATLEFHLQHPGIFSFARNLHLCVDYFFFLY